MKDVASSCIWLGEEFGQVIYFLQYLVKMTGSTSGRVFTRMLGVVIAQSPLSKFLELDRKLSLTLQAFLVPVIAYLSELP